MSNWSSGYVTDIDYVYGYYPELSTTRIKLPLLNKGIASPLIKNACELGYGQGMSVNIHGASTNVNWYGTDFIPSQAYFAQDLASASGNNAKLYDESFLDFVNRKDLPDFEFIALHGIWSWVSDENRSILVDFIRRKLKVGGVLYISYNTMPGWSTMAPLRHLMTEYSEIIGSVGQGTVNRLNSAIEFTDKLMQTNPAFLQQNPTLTERFTKLKEQNKHYLAHEYFNKNWNPMYFTDVSRWLESAKVEYACSAQHHDHIDSINLTSTQQSFLNSIQNQTYRQSIYDYMINQQFRKDYWVKGLKYLSPFEKFENLQNEKFVMTVNRSDASLKIKGILGEVQMNEDIYSPILELLSDHKAKSFLQVQSELKNPNKYSQNVLLEVLMILTGNGYIHSAQSDLEIDEAKTKTDKLNAFLCEKARGQNQNTYLASPVTGSGFGVSRFIQLFLISISKGRKNPNEWAADAWSTLQFLNEKIVKDGKTLNTKEENLKELNYQATHFHANHLNILKNLQIV